MERYIMYGIIIFILVVLIALVKWVETLYKKTVALQDMLISLTRDHVKHVRDDSIDNHLSEVPKKTPVYDDPFGSLYD